MASAGHECLLPLLGVVPDLGGESQDAHAVPGVDLGLPQGSQPHLAALAVLPGGVVDAGALAEAAVARGAGAVDLVAVVGRGLALVLLILVLFVLLEAGVAEILVVPEENKTNYHSMLVGFSRFSKRFFGSFYVTIIEIAYFRDSRFFNKFPPKF